MQGKPRSYKIYMVLVPHFKHLDAQDASERKKTVVHAHASY